MKVSFACPYCGKQYRNIRKELVGRKAKCGCGNLIRIGGGEASTSRRRKRNSAVEEDGPKKPEKSRVPTVEVAQQSELLIDDHFSDLDDILSGRQYETADASPEPSRRSPAVPLKSSAYRPEAGLPEGVVESKPAQISNRAATIGFLAAVASATLAFWFGLLFVMVRFTDFDQFLLKEFSETIVGINLGKFGTEKISDANQSSFMMLGWAMWGTGLALMIFGAGQFLNAFVKLFLQRPLIRWIDGLTASAAIVFVFVVVAAIFLQSSHMAALNRELKQYEVPGLVGESTPANVAMVKERYQERNTRFLTVMIISGAIPFTVFGLSMTRLFATTHYAPSPETAGPPYVPPP